MILDFWSHVFPKTTLEWVATIFSTLAVIVFIVSVTFKNKNKILIIQVLSHILLGIGEFISKAWASIVQEVISIIRNILVYFHKNTKLINYILIILGVLIGLYCGLMGQNTFTPWKGWDPAKWYGYLPVIANLEYSIVVCNSKLNAKWLKLALAISSWLWGLSFMLQGAGLFLSGILNAINGCAAFIAFIRMSIHKNENEVNN